MNGLAGGVGAVEQFPRNEMGKVLRHDLAHVAGKRA
jgi:hypothetical protein